MPYNVTVDDISPLITYKGAWVDSYKSTSDPYTNQYLGQSFHASQTDGSQAKPAAITFNGTAIYIFGAKRGNHGHYIVTIDNGQAQRFDGYAPTQSDGTDGIYQVPLFAQTGLTNGMHTVVLTNDGGADAGRPYVDIDFITWTFDNTTTVLNKTLDDVAFSYAPANAWFTTSIYVGDYYGRTEHGTNVDGAQASLTFNGTGFYLYGGTLDDHGAFSVQIDNNTPVPLNGSTNGYHARVLLYYVDGLGNGTHNLTVTNTQGGRFLDIDYIDIIQPFVPPASQSSSVRGAKASNIVGIVCGVVIGTAWLSTAMWWLRRQKRRRAKAADVLNSDSEPYDPPTRYGSRSNGPEWSGTAPPDNSTTESPESFMQYFRRRRID